MRQLPGTGGQRRPQIAKAEFLRGLRLAQGIADRKSTMPMLANVLLRTQGKKQLLAAATDLNVSLTAELKSQNATEALARRSGPCVPPLTGRCRQTAPRSGRRRACRAGRAAGGAD